MVNREDVSYKMPRYVSTVADEDVYSSEIKLESTGRQEVPDLVGKTVNVDGSYVRD